MLFDLTTQYAGTQMTEKELLQFWEGRDDMPILRRVSEHYLIVPPTSCSCERAFSKAGLICNKRRRRLRDQKIEALVHLGDNRELVQQLLGYREFDIDQLRETLQELLKWGIAQGQIERDEKDDQGVG
jgi:hypothetical protein